MITETELEKQDKSLAIGKPKALAVMANRLNVEPQKLLQTLKDTVFKGANDSELLALVVVANEYGLSPLLKEIFAFPAKGGGITPVVSIDGWIAMVNRQPQLDGLEFEWAGGGELPESCTCVIYVKNRSHPVRITEFYRECFRATEPWKQMPRRMLRHKALKEAARVAFGFSGITDEDEARDIMRNADARVIEPRSFPPPRKVDPPDFPKPDFDAAPEKAAGAPPKAEKRLTADERKAPAAPAEPQPDPGSPTVPPQPAQSAVRESDPLAPHAEKKSRRSASETKRAKDILYENLSSDTVRGNFIEGLKLIKFPGVPADAELLSELTDITAQAILDEGIDNVFERIRDVRWSKNMQ